MWNHKSSDTNEQRIAPRFSASTAFRRGLKKTNRTEDTEYIGALQGIIVAFENSWCESCSRGIDAHTIVNVNGMPFCYCEYEPYED